MGLTSTIYAQIRGTFTGSPDNGDLTYKLESPVELAYLPSGTTAGKADLIFNDTRTIAASGSEDLDLAGSLAGPFGETLTFVKVKAILVQAASGNTNNVEVGGAASNAFVGPFKDSSDIVAIPPGGAALFAAPTNGWTVTAGTGDLLKVANSAGSTGVTYTITIIGTSA
jgi:hypothetical protein